MEGLVLLQDAVGRERRPLSSVVGPHHVTCSPRPSQRERARAARMAMTHLRPPDRVE